MQKIVVTGGLVSVEDGKKSPEEFAPARKVRVELRFDVHENEDASAHLSAVSVLASNKVIEILTGKAAPVKTTDLQPLTDKDKLAISAGVQAAPAAATEAPEKPKRAPRAPKAPATPAAPADALEDELTTAAPVPAADDFDAPIAPAAEAAKPVTDADLTHAVGVKNAKLKDPVKIRALIAEFNPDPKQVFQLRQIAADRRKEFLDKLEALA